MQKSDCFYLGRIVKKYSYKGELVIKLDTDDPHLYEKLESLFVNLDDALVPFFITKSLLRGDFLRVHFQGIDSESVADELIKKGVYLPLNLLPPLTGNKFYYHEIIDFTLTDVNHGKVGVIKGVDDRTAQALFEVYRGKKLILIPVVDDFLVHVNRETKDIVVETPVGLLEMYYVS